MNPKSTPSTLCRLLNRSIISNGRNVRSRHTTALAFGFTLALGANAQVSSINSAQIVPRVFDDIPTATLIIISNYPTEISFTESNVFKTNLFANRDVWYFSNNGGSNAYNIQSNDYFFASFSLTLT